MPEAIQAVYECTLAAAGGDAVRCCYRALLRRCLLLELAASEGRGRRRVRHARTAVRYWFAMQLATVAIQATANFTAAGVGEGLRVSLRLVGVRLEWVWWESRLRGRLWSSRRASWSARGTKRIGGAIFWVMIETTTVCTGAAGRLGRRRLRVGSRSGLRKAFEPEFVMFYVPADGAVGRGASAEALVVAEPEPRGEANASAADYGLVSKQGRGALWEAGYEHLGV